MPEFASLYSLQHPSLSSTFWPREQHEGSKFLGIWLTAWPKKIAWAHLSFFTEIIGLVFNGIKPRIHEFFLSLYINIY